MKTQQTDGEYLAHLALQKKELRKNFAIFHKNHLPELLEEHRNEIALMKKGKLLGIFADIDKAMAEGNKRFKDGVFTAHRINDQVIRLRGNRLCKPPA